MNIIPLIIANYGVDKDFIDNAKRIARAQIKQVVFPKLDGGFRVIRIPPVESKLIQYAVVEILGERVAISKFATAYYKGASVKRNAQMHAGNSYFIRIDLKDFFPSINATDFKNALNEQNLSMDEESWSLITKTCFDVKDRLGIGFPASPFICNVVMKKIDDTIHAKICDIGAVKFTRYSDDLIISSNTITELEQAKRCMLEVLNASESPKLKIHFKKTRKMSISRGNAIITGVKVRADKSLTVHPNIKNDSIFLLKLAEKHSINVESSQRLIGVMNYIKFIDPDLYNKLFTKYMSGYLIAKSMLPENSRKEPNKAGTDIGDL